MPQDATNKLKKTTDLASKVGTKLAAPADETTRELLATEDSYKQARKALGLEDAESESTGSKVAAQKPSQSDKVNPKDQYGSRPGEKRINVDEMTKPLPTQKQGLGSIPLYDEGGDVKLSGSESDIMKNAPRLPERTVMPRLRATAQDVLDRPSTLAGIEHLYNEAGPSLFNRSQFSAPSERLVPIDPQGNIGAETQGDAKHDDNGGQSVTARVPRSSLGVIHTHNAGMSELPSNFDFEAANKAEMPNYEISGDSIYVAAPGEKKPIHVAELKRMKGGHLQFNWDKNSPVIMDRTPVYDEGGDVDVNDGKHQLAVLEDGEKVLTPDQASAYNEQHPEQAHGPLMSASGDQGTALIQQDKQDAAKNGDLVGFGKAILNEKHFTQPTAPTTQQGLGKIALSSPSESHQDNAGGPLLSASAPQMPVYGGPGKSVAQGEPIPAKDLAGDERKFRLADYDTRIQQALDLGTADGKTEADRLSLAKMNYEQNNPWGTAGNHPGVLGKIGHVASKIGNIAGDVLAPSTMALIPGTELNKQMRRGALGSVISEDTENELRMAQADAANAKETPKPKLLTEAGNTYTDPSGIRYQRYAMPDGSAQWFPEGQAPVTSTKGLGKIALPQGGFFGAEKPNTSEQDKNRWSTLLAKKQKGDTLSAQEQQDYQNLAPQFSIGQSRADNINKNIDSILRDRQIPKSEWESYHVGSDTDPQTAKDAEHQADARSNEVWTSGQPARQQDTEERKQDEKDKRAMVYAEDGHGQTVMVSQYQFDHANPGTYLGVAEPVKSGDLGKDREAIRQLNDVQTNIDRYHEAIRQLAANPASISNDERKMMTELEAINKQAGGDLVSAGASAEGIHIAGAFPQWSAAISSRQYDRAAELLEKLSKNPTALNLVNGYLRVAASVPAYQKALTKVGRTNKETMELEIDNVPKPYYDPRTATSRMDAFQENVNRAYSGFPTNLPGMKPQNRQGNSRTQSSSVPSAGNAAYHMSGAKGEIFSNDGRTWYDANGNRIGR